MKILNNNTIDDLYGFSDITDLTTINGGSSDNCDKIYYDDPSKGCISGWEPDTDAKPGACNGNGGWDLGKTEGDNSSSITGGPSGPTGGGK